MRKSLLDLIEENNIEDIQNNIENYDVNYIFYQGTPNQTTALIYAVYYDRLEIVELLLKNKANVNIVNYDNETALIYSDDIYIIGDSTDASSIGSIPKSGYVAYSMGKVAGLASFYHLLEKESPAPSMINTCYSLVSQTEGISVSAVYKFNKDKNKIVTVKNASGLSPQRSNLIALNAWDWAQAIWMDMLT